MRQTTDTILLVRPSFFRKNEETAVNNFFQVGKDNEHSAMLALAEFDGFTKLLRSKGIRTLVVQDTGIYNTPDSIFPNNVISFHQDTAILYPMYADSRRRERKLNYLGELEKEHFSFSKIKDYSIYESQQQFLEGTGVLILDRVNNIAYCSISDRANENLFNLFCQENKYTAIAFEAKQTVNQQHMPIYHTNVMMSVGTHFCVICLDSIDDKEQRNHVIQSLMNSNKTIIPITEKQMHKFAGNILEVHSSDGTPYICMSTQAFDAFTDVETGLLSTFGGLLHAPLYTIENLGGGSARCMMAEVFYKD